MPQRRHSWPAAYSSEPPSGAHDGGLNGCASKATPLSPWNGSRMRQDPLVDAVLLDEREAHAVRRERRLDVVEQGCRRRRAARHRAGSSSSSCQSATPARPVRDGRFRPVAAPTPSSALYRRPPRRSAPSRRRRARPGRPASSRRRRGRSTRIGERCSLVGVHASGPRRRDVRRQTAVALDRTGCGRPRRARRGSTRAPGAPQASSATGRATPRTPVRRPGPTRLDRRRRSRPPTHARRRHPVRLRRRRRGAAGTA